MKMNNKMKALVQIVRGVILLAMGLSLMGCEEAKEVENITIQDTKPVVEERVEDVEGLCHYCHTPAYETFGQYEVCNYCCQALKVALDKANIKLYYDDLKRNFTMDEIVALYTHAPNDVVEANKEIDWLKIYTPVDMASEVCKLIEEDTGMDIPVAFKTTCCNYCHKDLPECGCVLAINEEDRENMNMQIYEAPTAMTAEEFDNAKCENCGHDVSDVIDNAGGYWCEACDYVK